MADEKLLESEKLTDEQLEEVAGGDYMDSWDVAAFLKTVGIYDRTLIVWVDQEELSKALNSIGIQLDRWAEPYDSFRNSYTVIATGQTLNQDQMMEYLHKKFPDVDFVPTKRKS